jgi:peptide deformylase
VAFTDQDGARVQQTFEELWGTSVQHQVDHLNGKLFIDYLTGLKRQLITRKMVKLKREQAREKDSA